MLLEGYKDLTPDELPHLLPHRLVDHCIDLLPSAFPPAKTPYRLSVDESRELKSQLADLRAKGYIRPSKSPFGAPVLFVRKADGTLRITYSGKLSYMEAFIPWKYESKGVQT